ncbi:MAG: cyclic nucleotide-binding domain-containing protein [Elusimicrobia bacterium]|nr:cyclic nucleotide-binding domain-containing protein [Elusimicrobiota bacterium]
MASANPARAVPSDPEAAVVARVLRLETFFPEFTGELCAKIFPRSGVCAYAPDEFVIEQGESGRDLFVLLAGSVSVTISMGSAGAEVATLGEEALLGEVALLRDGTRTASARAIVPTRAFRLMFEDMGYILQNNPDLAAHLQGLAKERTA